MIIRYPLPEIARTARIHKKYAIPTRQVYANQNYIFWDIETNQKTDGDNIKLEFDMAVFKYTQLHHDGTYKVLKRYDCHSEIEVLEAIKDIQCREKHPYFIAHNTKFDIQFSHILHYLGKENWIISMFYETMTTFLMSLTRNKQRLSFIDSMNWFSEKLEELAPLVGMRKDKENMFNPNKKIRLKYCANDVDILIKLFARYKKWLWDNFSLNIKLTRGSDAFNIFRHELGNTDIQRSGNQLISRKELASYLGGRTECFKYGDLSGDIWYKYDINSLYPYVMAVNKYPAKYHHSIIQPSVDKCRELVREYSCLAFVTGNVDTPCFPVMVGEEMMFPVGHIEGYYCGKELEYLLNIGTDLQIGEIFMYENEHIFHQTISKLYQFKEKATLEGKDFDRKMVKLIMNSIYGKMAQRNENVQYICDIDDSDAYNVYEINSKGMLEVTNKVMNKQYYSVEKNVLGAYSFPIIPACITSNARMYLWNFMEQVGLENIAYIDTDSIICNGAGSALLEQYADDAKIGKWKFEGESTNLVVRGLKDYTFDNVDTIKSIPKDATKIAPDTYIYEHINTLKETGVGTREPQSDVNTVQKQLKREYMKSKLCEKCGYSPWHDISPKYAYTVEEVKKNPKVLPLPNFV